LKGLEGRDVVPISASQQINGSVGAFSYGPRSPNFRYGAIHRNGLAKLASIRERPTLSTPEGNHCVEKTGNALDVDYVLN
jgi:hypothetical protein